MTIIDYDYTERAYRELRDSGASQQESIERLFKAEIGRLELINAVEVVDGLSATEARKCVAKALAG